MQIYLIRHGETDLNKKDMLQGQMDIPLNERGRDLARKTGEALKDVEFDLAYSSHLSRAYETAEIVLGDRGLEIKTDERLQEISFGEYEGRCYGAKGYNVPDPEFMNFFIAPHLYNAPKGGESFEAVMERATAAFEELVRDPANKNKTVLLSTHGCTLKGILASLRNTELKDFWGSGVHKNCAVTLIDISEKGFEVIYEGKTFY